MIVRGLVPTLETYPIDPGMGGYLEWAQSHSTSSLSGPSVFHHGIPGINLLEFLCHSALPF